MLITEHNLLNVILQTFLKECQSKKSKSKEIGSTIQLVSILNGYSAVIIWLLVCCTIAF